MSMVPRYSTAPFVAFEDLEGEYTVMEAEFFTDIEAVPDSVERYNEDGEDTVWFCELHMPGYLDRTGWDGPFQSEEEARNHIADTYDVDPDTGAYLEEDD